MKTFAGFIFTVMTFFVLSGCVTTNVKYEVANLEQSAQFQVQDLRPESERETKSLSKVFSSKTSGIMRVGDAETGLNSVRLFQHRVHEKLGNSSDEYDVKVYHLVTYVNYSSSMNKGGLSAAFGGLIGATITDLDRSNTPLPENVNHVDRAVFEESIAEEYVRAYYSEEENPDESDVVIVFLDAEINGKRKFLRRISKFDNGQEYRFLVEDTDKITEAFLADF